MMRMELILSDYNDAYTLLKRTITGADTAARNAGARNGQIIFKNCTPFSNSTSEKPEKKTTQIDN